MAETITEGDSIQETPVQSFDPGVLKKIQIINPDPQVSPLYGLWGFDLRFPQPSEARALCPMVEMVILNPWVIR